MKVYTILADELYLRGHTRGTKDELSVTETLRAINCGCVIVMAGLRDRRVSRWLDENDGLYIHCPIPDGKQVLPALLNSVVRSAMPTIRNGRSVLVHCHAGRNRSALLAALIVRERLGISGAEAVRYLRSRRPNALANEAFVEYLNGLEQPTKGAT